MSNSQTPNPEELGIESTRRSQYYFGRFNIIAVYEDKRNYLEIGLSTPETINKYGQNWRFCDIDLVENLDGSFFSGHLVKYNPEGEGEEVVNPETGQIEETILTNSVTAKSRFFLDVRTGLIAYCPRPGISEKQFKEFFCELFKIGHQYFFVSAEIQDLEEDYDFFQRIERFDTISSVSIYLHPSNPSNNDRWKRIDERMKRLNASSYRETIKSEKNDESLQIQEDEEFMSKAQMAQDGYGKATVKGLMGGEKHQIVTGEKPVKGSAPSEGSGEWILSDLLPTFRSIFQRTPNKPEENEDNT
jgi:hypothetical protein